VNEFYGDVLSVTGAATVAHHPEFMPFLELAGHLFTQLSDLIGALGEKSFFDFH
jgi:hypothetical protein